MPRARRSVSGVAFRVAPGAKFPMSPGRCSTPARRRERQANWVRWFQAQVSGPCDRLLGSRRHRRQARDHYPGRLRPSLFNRFAGLLLDLPRAFGNSCAGSGDAARGSIARGLASTKIGCVARQEDGRQRVSSGRPSFAVFLRSTGAPMFEPPQHRDRQARWTHSRSHRSKGRRSTGSGSARSAIGSRPRSRGMRSAM